MNITNFKNKYKSVSFGLIFVEGEEYKILALIIKGYVKKPERSFLVFHLSLFMSIIF